MWNVRVLMVCVLRVRVPRDVHPTGSNAQEISLVLVVTAD